MNQRRIHWLSLLALAGVWVFPGPVLAQSGEPAKKVLFLAGPPSHGYGAHEHYAGCVLLAKSLQAGMPEFETDVVRHQWPEDPEAFDHVAAVVMYSDGGPNHPAIKHRDQINKLAEQGIGIVCIHYAVEMPPGEAGDDLMNWIGGYFETNWSVNPHWLARFENLPDHEITRGVEPFATHDEWYFHMRFPADMQGVTPILSAVAPESTMSRADGPHSGNPHVRKSVDAGDLQHLAWAVERNDGGRGFGCTGGHFHWNWADPNFRRVVLNAIVWTAGADVPNSGVAVSAVDLAQLKENQDFDQTANWSDDKIRDEFLSTPDENPNGR